ncbi:MAG TPA: IS1182 family transposase, partial [Methylophilus sp.]
MVLRAPLAYTIPEETATLARSIVPRGNLLMTITDTFGMLFTNDQFAHLFSSTGQPACDPARLAMVLVLQYMEGLSDRQAADAVRLRIDWKYALALPLAHRGFDASVLTEFRQRLSSDDAQCLFLDTLLADLQQAGFVKARGIQRTDSTMILANIRLLTRLELIGETIRATLNQLASREPTWLCQHMHPEWHERYAERINNYRLPKAKSARHALATTYGADGFTLLTALTAPDTPRTVRTLPMVATLWRVWLQQFYGPSETPVLRADADVPMPAGLIHSPYDPDARYSMKRGTTWIGYKVHITESCDPDQPRLVTTVHTTPATTPDDPLVPQIHATLAKKKLLPATHLVDCGYTSSETLVQSQQDYAVRVLGPVAHDPSWQARERTGYDNQAFVIDWDQQQARCPQGHTSGKWRFEQDITGQAVVHIRFLRKDCSPCPVRTHCTRGKHEPRSVTIRTQIYHEALQQARQYQRTPAFH